MPTAGKVFVYREELSFEEIYKRLKDYKYSSYYEEADKGFNLIADIVHLHHGPSTRTGEEGLEGLFRYDTVVSHHHRSGPQIFPRTIDAPFLFKRNKGTVFLIITAKKQTANNVANELSKILHDEIGTIVEAVITPKAIKGFYEEGEGTKILLFQNILIPNMDKLTLYGDNVVQTDLYGEYVNEGEPWYIVTKTIKKGYTIGLVRDGSVVVFNTLDMMSFIEYVEDEIFPLVLRRK